MTTSTTPLALAALARASALEVSDVLAVAPEHPGAATTYGPGRSVEGGLVQVSGGQGRVLLHLALRYGAPMDRVTGEVRAKVSTALAEAAPDIGAWRVDLRITDLVVHDERPGREASAR